MTPRTPARIRIAVAGVALAVTVTACGGTVEEHRYEDDGVTCYELRSATGAPEGISCVADEDRPARTDP